MSRLSGAVDATPWTGIYLRSCWLPSKIEQKRSRTCRGTESFQIAAPKMLFNNIVILDERTDNSVNNPSINLTFM
jgi:hypothetical protein